jgi:hypothetical protein
MDHYGDQYGDASVISDRAVYRLAGAVLLQAIQDVGSSSIGRRSAALRWISSDEEASFSFTFICRVLNRDAEEVRRFCEEQAARRRRMDIPFYETLRQQAAQHAAVGL